MMPMKWQGKHSMHPNAPCAACGDIEGCHLPSQVRYATKPKIVCLCGSTRFYDAFQEANYRETMAGKIVLSVGFYPHSANVHGEGVGATEAEKEKLDILHCQKIDMADEVLVLNVGGYIGESTFREVQYAHGQHKLVRFLETAK